MKYIVLTILLALPLPIFAALTEKEAIQSLMAEIKENQYHDLPIECLLPKSFGYKNAGYTIELFNTCGKQSHPFLVSRWRIDANSGKLFRQNEKGKYTPPSSVERVNILLVNMTHPYYWLKVILLEKIPALHKWSDDISKNSKGKAQLGVEFDAPSDQESNNEYDVNYHNLRLGEEHENHFVTYDRILVHKLTKEIVIKTVNSDPDSSNGEDWIYAPLSSWERLKQ